MKRVFLLPRVLIVVTIVIALIGGLSSGLARLGWRMDSLSQGWILIHGPLMICGFLGTLICLERAVALSRRAPIAYAVPFVTAVGAAFLLVDPNATIAKILITVGSLGLLTISAVLLRMHYARYMVVMTLGAAVWMAGNLLWLAGYPLFQVAHFWTAFLIVTIVGERLELSRLRMLPKRIENQLFYAIYIYLAGVIVVIFSVGWGMRILGVGAILMAVWLLRYDITRLTIFKQGLARYIAVCLLLGYVWLAIGGALGIWFGAVYGGPFYAAILHAFLLGFVFSMIFGHAPIIFPAVSGLRLDYSPIFYGHLALLQITLAYRTVVNLMVAPAAQQWAGLFTVVAVLLFMVVTAVTVVKSNRGVAVASSQ